ncbi:Invertebrate defensins family profile domain-containing protein [Caenorhabditis elegans]|uniref:Invertebrate defensins family profile domain-containing protein n=1 Tax=Caenorhabditis elegans TaxID=6239 RepID=Q7YZW2_CAEEL|nr:Invertebrate defensins family profile domain-containing protein [Caenorhabditis elegans]CCD72257.1 Invertebrate defensins family profile domain-containing protein [Caenorhabditis elegans]|eukprot:NP_001022639.1 FIP (Fungus-Induced Protein) Related [Caenorhabditis elegans]
MPNSSILLIFLLTIVILIAPEENHKTYCEVLTSNNSNCTAYCKEKPECSWGRCEGYFKTNCVCYSDKYQFCE